MTNEEIIHAFYTAFTQKDVEAMLKLYHSDIVFSDPAFGVLKGQHAGNMWKMLIQSQKGKTFDVTFDHILAEGDTGQAQWEAKYIFSPTQRPIHNRISANFKFKEGKIIEHHDHFSLFQWARQAYGFKGWLIGGTSLFKSKLQQQTRKMLTKWESQ